MNNSLEHRVTELEKELELLKAQVFRPKRLDVRATARYVGIAEKTVRNKISWNSKEGKYNDPDFPQPKRSGRKVLWLVSDLDAYLEAQE